MKTKFYHPHTVIDDIKEIDDKWLKSKSSQSPFDRHYAYLHVLSLIGKEKRSEAIDAIGQLVQNTNGQIRIGALLERAISSNSQDAHVIDTITIKSRKSVASIESSSILAGLATVDSSIYEDAIVKSKKKKKKKKQTPNDLPIVDDIEVDEYISESVIEIIDVEVDSNDPLDSDDQNKDFDHTLSYTRTQNRTSLSDSVQIKHSPFSTWLQEISTNTSEPMITKEIGSEQTQSNNPISEPLARLLAIQGHQSDAIKMYQQLMLKYPEKSSFFADQIENLK